MNTVVEYRGEFFVEALDDHRYRINFADGSGRDRVIRSKHHEGTVAEIKQAIDEYLYRHDVFSRD